MCSVIGLYETITQQEVERHFPEEDGGLEK